MGFWRWPVRKEPAQTAQSASILDWFDPNSLKNETAWMGQVHRNLEGLFSIPAPTHCKRHQMINGTNGRKVETVCPRVSIRWFSSESELGRYRASFRAGDPDAMLKDPQVFPELGLSYSLKNHAQTQFTFFHELWHLIDGEILSAPGWTHPAARGWAGLWRELSSLDEVLQLDQRVHKIEQLAKAHPTDSPGDQAEQEKLAALAAFGREYLSLPREWMARSFCRLGRKSGLKGRGLSARGKDENV